MKRLRQQMWNCSLQVSRACKRCHRIRPFLEEFYVNLSRVGTFSLLKVNKNSCLFSFLKNSCLKLFFYGIVCSLCMIPLWLTYNPLPPPRCVAKMRIKQNHSLCCFLFRCTSQRDSLVEQPVAVKNIICISQFRSFIIPAFFFSHSLITIGSGWHQGQAMCVCPD